MLILLMATIDLINSITNPLIKIILRSPLHYLIDDRVLLIIYTGRSSGRSFSVPVNYLDQGKILRIVSLRNRNWWQNLRGGAAVKVIIKGIERNAWVDLIEDHHQVAEQINMLCKDSPAYAIELNLQKDERGDFIQEDIMKAAQERVILIVKLN